MLLRLLDDAVLRRSRGAGVKSGEHDLNRIIRVQHRDIPLRPVFELVSLAFKQVGRGGIVVAVVVVGIVGRSLGYESEKVRRQRG